MKRETDSEAMRFDTSGMEPKRMDISLENILPSLAKALYGEDWRITIRELLQNCHDALVERQAREEVPREESLRIDIFPDPAQGTLTFKDNGMGMTAGEVQEYLATIGSGYKRKQIQELAEADKADRKELDRIIGQYGIGFLSCFIVADKVLVRSRSRAGGPGVKALFTGETRWYSAPDASAEPGTEVVLQLKREPVTDPLTGKKMSVLELLNFENLKREVRRFGDLLPFPISVHRDLLDLHGDVSTTIQGPWEAPGFIPSKAYDFLRNRNPGMNEPFACFTFSFGRGTDKVEAHGLLYFPRAERGVQHPGESVSRVDLFCKRMFITNDIQALLPDWATFVGAVVECSDLTPTLNRNDVIRYDPSFIALKEALGKQTIATLRHFGDKQPRMFLQLLDEHRERFYLALLMDYEKSPAKEEHFFRGVIDYVPFVVVHRGAPSGQEMTLPQYRTEIARLSPQLRERDGSSSAQIYYLDNERWLGQIRAMITQRNIPVIQALNPAEPQLLRAYGAAFPKEVSVQDVSAILDLYVERVDQAPYEAMKQFLASLRPGPDEVQVSRFEPAYLPAIMAAHGSVEPAKANVLQQILEQGGSVLGGRVRQVIMDEIASAQTGRGRRTIILNDSNAVIRAVRDYCQRGNPLAGVFADVLIEVYNIALAYADPRVEEDPKYHEGRNNILLTLLEREQATAKLQVERDQLSLSIKSLQAELTRFKEPAAPMQMEPRECAMLLTDLSGSTGMVGFTDQAESAEFLREYANGVAELVRKAGGKIEKFTGDGVFAHFGPELGSVQEAVRIASDCAYKIPGFTSKYFSQGKVKDSLLAAGINITGSRTVLHYGKPMYGEVAGIPALVGRAVVALFRACEDDALFRSHSIVISEPFHALLGLPRPLRPIARDVELDASLPKMTFYPHPAL